MQRVCDLCGLVLTKAEADSGRVCPTCRSQPHTKHTQEQAAVTPLERRLRALQETLDRHSAKPRGRVVRTQGS